jgi:hypothetical protein
VPGPGESGISRAEHGSYLVYRSRSSLHPCSLPLSGLCSEVVGEKQPQYQGPISFPGEWAQSVRLSMRRDWTEGFD